MRNRSVEEIEENIATSLSEIAELNEEIESARATLEDEKVNLRELRAELAEALAKRKAK